MDHCVPSQRRVAALLSLAASVLPVAPAAAQQGTRPAEASALETIVVTAQRRTQDLQDVPVAVSALGSAELERSQIAEFYDLDLSVPNVLVKYSAGSNVTPGVYIRGIGAVDSTWNVESGVGVYVDDMFISGTLGSSFMIMDMERIEVLRGPQGTLYGRNSTGGAMKWVVRRPDLTATAFKGDVTIGSYDRRDFRASLGVPMVEGRLGLKLDGVSQSQDGYVDRITDGRTINYTNNDTARAALLWRPTDRFEAYVIGIAGRDDAGPMSPTPTLYDVTTDTHAPQFGAENLTQTGVGVRDVSLHKTWSLNAQLSWQLDVGTVKSITTWRDIDSTMSGDLDGTIQGIFAGITPTGPLFVNIDFDQHYDDRTITQELQYSATLADRLNLVAGLFYYNRELEQDTWSKIVFPAGMRQLAKQTTESYAAYVDGTWALTDRWDVFAGLRYTNDQKDVDHAGEIVSRNGIGTPYGSDRVAPLFDFRDLHDEWTNVSGRIGTQFRFTDQVNAYLSGAQGFKPGQIAVSRGPDPINSGRFVDEETSTTYELGLKSSVLDNRMILNAAVFYTEYEGYQTGALDTQGNLLTSGTAFDLQGAELEVTWRALDALTLWASYGYLTHDFPDDPQNRLVVKDAPRHNARLAFDYAMPTNHGTWGLAGNYRYQSEVYFSNVARDPARLQEGYGLLDAQLYYLTPDRRIRVSLSGQNLADESYALVGNAIPGALVLQPAGVTVSQAQRFLAPGRTWSVSLSYSP